MCFYFSNAVSCVSNGRPDLIKPHEAAKIAHAEAAVINPGGPLNVCDDESS